MKRAKLEMAANSILTQREKDIGDDQIITVYRNRDSTKPVEPTLQHKDVDSTISLDRFIAPPDCKFNNSFDAYHDQMNAQFYAQARALQVSERSERVLMKTRAINPAKWYGRLHSLLN